MRVEGAERHRSSDREGKFESNLGDCEKRIFGSRGGAFGGRTRRALNGVENRVRERSRAPRVGLVSEKPFEQRESRGRAAKAESGVESCGRTAEPDIAKRPA